MKSSTQELTHSPVEIKFGERLKNVRRLEERNVDANAPLLANDVVQEIMLSANGSQAPSPQFEGKKAILGHLNQIVANFSRTVLVDKQVYVTVDGTVFMEAKGDLIFVDTGAPYKNVYVFKFVFRLNLISRISEYGNPVRFAKLVGSPLG
jgi:ketosteroid isomerase-like protein